MRDTWGLGRHDLDTAARPAALVGAVIAYDAAAMLLFGGGAPAAGRSVALGPGVDLVPGRPTLWRHNALIGAHCFHRGQAHGGDHIGGSLRTQPWPRPVT